MKIQFSIWTKPGFIFKIIEGKTESEAFDKAVQLYGATGFTDFKRYYKK